MNEVFIVSMLPVETNVLCVEVNKKFIRVMPRVVSDQRSRFENDELFRKLSREGEVKYTGFRDRPQEERQLRLQTECREGHAEVAFLQTGTNLQLHFNPNAWSERTEDRVPTREYVDFERETGKVHLKSQFILNGVCVIWRGWLDLHRLDGTGCIEYDMERATVEDNLLREQLDQYNRQLQDFEARQRHYREEQERRAEAEAEQYRRLLRTRVEMFEKSQSLLLLGMDRSRSPTEVTEGSKRSRSETRREESPGRKTDTTKKFKTSETEVQVPVPIKAYVTSRSLPMTNSLAVNNIANSLAVNNITNSLAMNNFNSLAVNNITNNFVNNMSSSLAMNNIANSLTANNNLARNTSLAFAHSLGSGLVPGGHRVTTPSLLVNSGIVGFPVHSLTGSSGSLGVHRNPVKLYPWKPNMYIL